MISEKICSLLLVVRGQRGNARTFLLFCVFLAQHSVRCSTNTSDLNVFLFVCLLVIFYVVIMYFYFYNFPLRPTLFPSLPDKKNESLNYHTTLLPDSHTSQERHYRVYAREHLLLYMLNMSRIATTSPFLLCPIFTLQPKEYVLHLSDKTRG